MDSPVSRLGDTDVCHIHLAQGKGSIQDTKRIRVPESWILGVESGLRKAGSAGFHKRLVALRQQRFSPPISPRHGSIRGEDEYFLRVTVMMEHHLSWNAGSLERK
ncbi:MAG: hypothetical protein ACPG1Z_07915 [Planctomycetota bacterium]